jgi:hypothetical protein
MAISLPDSYAITSADETERLCEFCLQPGVIDPDELDRSAEHLVSVHGYALEMDDHGNDRPYRTLRFRLVDWSARAKFRPNERVDVNGKAPTDYGGRRGTVVGWHSDTSDYVVRFDEEPVSGFLRSDCLQHRVTPAV